MSDDEFDHTESQTGAGDDGEFHFEMDEDVAQMEAKVKNAKDGLQIFVDARPGMFRPNQAGEIPFQVSMKLIARMMRKKVITSSRTMIGLSFFGTRNAQNPQNYQHLYDFIGLDVPAAGKILQVENFAEWSESAQRSFKEKIGSLETTQNTGELVENLLAFSTFAFREQKLTTGDSRRVWIFTNDADPCQHEPASKEKTLVRAKDMRRSGEEITVWVAENEDDRVFDFGKFWRKVTRPTSADASSSDHQSQSQSQSQSLSLDLYDDEDLDTACVFIPTEAEVIELVDNSKKKEFAKRTLASIPLNLGHNVEIGVRAYAIVLEQKLPTAIKIEQSTGRPVTTKTKWICADTVGYLSQDQILYTSTYGGVDRVLFTNEDKKRVKRFAPAGIQLLGFKPLKELEVWMNMRAPYLIRPDEKAVKGSNRAFIALVGEMITQKVFGVARLIMNKSAAPKLCALVAQEEVCERDSGEVITPMGLLVIQLPYANDVRTPSFPEPMEQASPHQVELAKKAISFLCNQDEFDPRKYENPALQKLWTHLEAHALDKRDLTWEESKNDLLQLPNEEDLLFDQEFVSAMQAFNNSYGGAGELEAKKRAPSTTARKRTKTTEDDDEDKPKRTKKGPLDHSSVDWKQKASDGTLSKLTVEELKTYFDANGLKKPKKKQDYIDEITNRELAS